MNNELENILVVYYTSTQLTGTTIKLYPNQIHFHFNNIIPIPGSNHNHDCNYNCYEIISYRLLGSM